MSIDISTEQVDKVIAWASDAAGIVAQEGSVIAEQILKWEAARLWVGIFVALFWLVFIGGIAVIAIKTIIKACINGDSYGNWSWPSWAQEEGGQVIIYLSAIFGSIVSFGIMFAELIPRILSLLQIHLAPKVYLLEYFRSLAG